MDIEKDTRLAEFKALRDESLRSAQLLANAVWVAVTGYAVTIGAAAAFLGRAGTGGRAVREEMLLPAILALLCLEAMAISAMYLSELWKYIRVGAYIREELKLPTHWEQWIEQHRAYELYLGSLMYLQLPVIIAICGGGLSFSVAWGWFRAEPGSVFEFVSWLGSDTLLAWILVATVVLDVLVVLWLSWRVLDARKGHFGWPNRVVSILNHVERRRSEQTIRGAPP